LQQNLNAVKAVSRVPTTHGSKLEPITSKEYVNLKNITLEKRLKNSETCPEQLSPTLPQTSDRVGHKPSVSNMNLIPTSTKGNQKRNVGAKMRDVLDRTQPTTS